MRVILLKDVERLGHEGDVVDVRDGYARNYLLPRGLATQATAGALRDLELRRDAIERRNMQKRETAMAVAEKIKDQPVVIERMVGDRGRLHGRVTTTQIAEAISQQLQISVDRRDLELHEPIKAVGDYTVTARLFKDVVVDLTVRVQPFGGEEEEAEETAAAEEAQAEVQETAEEQQAEAATEETAEEGGEEAAEADAADDDETGAAAEDSGEAAVEDEDEAVEAEEA